MCTGAAQRLQLSQGATMRDVVIHREIASRRITLLVIAAAMTYIAFQDVAPMQTEA